MASSVQSSDTRRDRPAAQPQGQYRGRIVSHAPGRMRVRLQPQHRDPAALQDIEQDLGSQDGVKAVTTDARTGSVLVHYDHRTLTRDDLTDMLLDVGVVALDLLGAEEVAEDVVTGPGKDRPPLGGVAPHSAPAAGILDALTDLDQRISQLSGGKLDLKILVPAGLGLLALRQIGLNGLGLGQMPGYVLLWYTFDSFYKLHQRKTAAAVKEATAQIVESGVATPPDNDR